MLADELVFSVNGEGYRWFEVIIAAIGWGEWESVERRARHGHACALAAQTAGLALPKGALEKAGQEFRYARDLVTAHSMEQWLQRHGMTAREWTGYLRRSLHLTLHIPTTDAHTLAEQEPADRSEGVHLALVDAVCSGDADRWARALAARVAARRTVAGAEIDSGDGAPFDETIAAALGVDESRWRDAAKRIHAVDALFDRFRAAQVTEHALESCVATRQLDWVRFDCRVMAFPEADMAAEAAMLLREDDEGFTSVYRAAHAVPRETTLFFEHIDAPMRDRFLAAKAGDLVGPVRAGNEFVIYFVDHKILPTARDPEIRRRAEDLLLSQALKQQLDHRVEWHAVLH